LRHLFITRCIESGVDIPTIAKWVGQNMLALLMKTYSHLLKEHSQALAAKLVF
jgi:integrase